MKKIRIILICFALLHLNNLDTNAQNYKLASNYLDSLKRSIKIKDINHAVFYSINVVKINSTYFEDELHTGMSQRLIYEKDSTLCEYLKLLHNNKNIAVNKIINPIYTLSLIIKENRKSQLDSLLSDFYKTLKDKSDINSKAESYGLIVLKELRNKKYSNQILENKLLNRILANTQAYRFIDSTVIENKPLRIIRAWNRYILSQCYFNLYNQNRDNIDAEKYLKLAVKYSPDDNDKLVQYAYYYDAAFITDIIDPKDFGFENVYVEFLISKNRKREALSLLTHKALIQPTDEYMDKLYKLFKSVDKNKSFNEYWLESINNYCQKFPDLAVKFTNDIVVKTTDLKGKWTYIDIWGTWCSPCVRELPELEKLYSENIKYNNTQLNIYTYSYNSQQLSIFMTKNKYSFPVAEINDKVISALNISSYPTKILITPQGNYLKIPIGVDWKKYIENYIRKS